VEMGKCQSSFQVSKWACQRVWDQKITPIYHVFEIVERQNQSRGQTRTQRGVLRIHTLKEETRNQSIDSRETQLTLAALIASPLGQIYCDDQITSIGDYSYLV